MARGNGVAARTVMPDESPYANVAVAATYAEVAEPFQFARPAHDLVAVAHIGTTAVVLDVGTGTGAVARHAAERGVDRGLVVGVDGSMAMLRARRPPAVPVAQARLPGLPFADGTFDVVTAGFVITHCADFGGALADLYRACRAGGRAALSVWGTLPNRAAQLWNDIAGAFGPAGQLTDALRVHIPWDAYFSDSQNLREALEEAGFAAVTIETREYTFTMPTADFLRAREASVQAFCCSGRSRTRSGRPFARVPRTRFSDSSIEPSSTSATCTSRWARSGRCSKGHAPRFDHLRCVWGAGALDPRRLPRRGHHHHASYVVLPPTRVPNLASGAPTAARHPRAGQFEKRSSRVAFVHLVVLSGRI